MSRSPKTHKLLFDKQLWSLQRDVPHNTSEDVKPFQSTELYIAESLGKWNSGGDKKYRTAHRFG